MTQPSERHRRLRDIFDEVIGLEPTAHARYLDAACGGDAELRAEVVRLVSAYQQAPSFLEHPLDLLPSLRDEARFEGTTRFRVVRRLGAGGMGVVYEVQDELRGESVALKMLRRGGPADLYRLKREFRSLADVTHPHLVCLYELFVDEAQSFFTMELVPGIDFVRHVRSDERGLGQRIRAVFPQLVAGVLALHRRGKLHRDIKPSNVLVTPEGRVVILDFGLTAERAPSGETRHVRGGTPAYMAPEEMGGAGPSEASDWYAVGVTLYEALTGHVPFDGDAADVMARKQVEDPAWPVGAPEDLRAICLQLLSRRPDKRPSGGELAQLLAAASISKAGVPRDPESLFVGRQRELDHLRTAFQALDRHTATAVAIHGPSGIGKSALLRKFLDEVGQSAGTVVLAGRCYENESVPYKALDGVIDDLSVYLLSLPPGQIDALLPPDLSSLIRLFPVLRQVHGVAAASRREPAESADPLRIRRKAFDALAVLIGRLAAMRRLVIWIDDLQWADTDSLVLLEELLSPTRVPAMLTLLTFRSEEMAGQPFLRSLLEREGQPGWTAVPMAPLTEIEARGLIDALLPDDSLLADRDRRQMTAEAAGSPLVLEELARFTSAAAGPVNQAPTFAVAFDHRMAALPASVRGFLETLALCGRPMAPEIICAACGIARDRQSLIVMLRASQLIRSSGSSARVETYHDRIREVLAAGLDAGEAKRRHARLAAVLVASRSEDCEALFEHYRGADDRDRAVEQAELAAAKASAALAFDRAASLYGAALALAPGAAAVPVWREGLATALANAGRPAEAAEAYLAAAEVNSHRQVEFRRRAAEQLLTGGHIDRGLELIRRVLESVGLRLAATPRRALVSLVWRRLRLIWRGTGFTSRAESELDRELVLRLDTCWSIATGLALVDIITASDFIAQHLKMALDAGEPSRIVRGLAVESSARSADWTFRRSSVSLAARAEKMAEELGTPQARAITLMADAISATSVGHWRRALTSSERALTILRDQCVGMSWEVNMAQNMFLWGLMYLGEIGEVCRRVPPLLAEARRRGNLYLAAELCTRVNLVWLAADDPDGGEREVMDTLGRWSKTGFHRQHYSARLALVQTALYRGDAATAWRLFNEYETGYRSSMLDYVQALRVESRYLHGRVAIAMAAATGSGRYLGGARASARRIVREGMPWARPLGLLLSAGVASVEGDAVAAVKMLRSALAQFEQCEMKWYAGVSRRQLGCTIGGAEGRQLREEADGWMASQQILNPVSTTRMLVPGFPDCS